MTDLTIEITAWSAAKSSRLASNHGLHGFFYDIVEDREIVNVRMGKGRKDRVVPIGQRAMSWTRKWLSDVRPTLVKNSNTHALFVSFRGNRFGPNHISKLVRDYLTAIGSSKKAHAICFVILPPR